jgi:hypothetical protein
MTQPPTIAQLRNLTDRADRGPLQPAEVALLRAGIDELAAHRARAEPVPVAPIVDRPFRTHRQTKEQQT